MATERVNGSLKYISATDWPSHKSSHHPATHSAGSCTASWHLDDEWLAARRRADARHAERSNATSDLAPGCCPAIIEFYTYQRPWRSNSSADINQTIVGRCCVDRLDAHALPSLRSTGGATFNDFIRNAITEHARPDLLMIGDSMGEQLMLAMLCKAWSEGYDVSFAAANPSSLSYKATVSDTRDFKHAPSSSRALPILEIRFVRFQNPPTLAEVQHAVNGGNESYVLLETWYERSVAHGWDAKRILGHAQDMLATCAHLRPHARLVAMDAAVKHFPGGKWSPYTTYPPASSTRPHAACNDAVPADEWLALGWFNAALANVTAHHGAGVARMASLYRDAGAFHVGFGQDLVGKGLRNKYLQGGRDCLHWCLVPSIIDSWASTAFSAIIVRHSCPVRL